MKKFLVLLMLLCAFVLASCDEGETPHTHSYTVYVSDNNATCVANGTETAKCDGCEETDTREVVDSKLGHSFTTYTSDNNATCGADGTETAKCDRCDVTDTRTIADSKLGHSFTNYVSDNNATCTADGTETAKCDSCDATDTRTVANSKKEHSFTNYVSDNNATCTADGTETAKCDGCEETDTRTVADSKTGHSFTNYVSDNNATCIADGTETAKCDGCEETDTRTDVDSKTGHSFTNYVSNNDATLEADGTETAKCDHCEETDTRVAENSNQVVTDYMLDAERKYTGLLVNNLPEGEGTLIFVNSNCKYTGSFVNGLYHGQGTFDWSLDGTGWKFVGTFVEGRATYGKTTTNKVEGLIWYEGAMNDLNNIKADELGTGYWDYANGCNYTGQMYASGALEECSFHGEGVFKWSYDDTGWKFEGSFAAGAATYGKTTTNKTSGLIWYEGAMNGLNNIDAAQLGTGYYDYGNGCSYTGQMYAFGAVEGCTFHGEGTFRWPDGQTFVGTYNNGSTVTGKLTYPNTMSYEGQFDGGYTFHGQGTFNWTTYNQDGSVNVWSNRYVGQFANGGATGLTGTMYYIVALDGSNGAGLHYFTGVMETLGLAAANQTGSGKFVFEDGSYYIGNVYLNPEHVASVTGEGKYYNADGSEKGERKVVTDYMLDEERKYTGLLVNNLPEGEGTLIFVNSNCKYTGSFVNGLYHGQGTFDWSLDGTGWKFVGTFVEGRATYGKTTTNKVEGLIWYEGAMNDLNNIKADELGTGYWDYANGCNYTGQMYASGALEGCTFHGEGTFKWSYDESGWKFAGTFVEGNAVYGKTTTNKIEGLVWYEGAMNGLNNIKAEELGTGCYDYGNGCTYTGQMYAHGALEGCTFHGEGTFRWPDGQTFVGTYNNGATVTGKLTYPNTMSYEGQFDGGYTFHGQGTFNWTTYNQDGSVNWGNRYVGEFAHGGATGLTGTMYYVIALDGSNGAGLHYFTGVMETLGLAAANQTGSGKFVFEDGTYYIGEITLDANYAPTVTGNGTYYNADGSVKA